MKRWKVAWVFGGSEGIGRAVSEALAEQGTRLVIMARREEILQQTASEIGDEFGIEVVGIVADVEDPLSVARACDEAAAKCGVPQLVVNCAGRAKPGRFTELNIDDLRATLRVNLEGPWNVAQAALPHLEEHGGTLVQTASLAGLIPVYGYSDYAASKAGVIAMCEVLRQELGPKGIDVRVLCPPDVDTPGFEEENRTKPAETVAISAAASLMSPKEVASELLEGLQGKRPVIVPGRSGKWTWRAKRAFPRWVERFLRFEIRRS